MAFRRALRSLRSGSRIAVSCATVVASHVPACDRVVLRHDVQQRPEGLACAAPGDAVVAGVEGGELLQVHGLAEHRAVVGESPRRRGLREPWPCRPACACRAAMAASRRLHVEQHLLVRVDSGLERRDAEEATEQSVFSIWRS